MHLRLIPPVGSGSAQRNMEELSHRYGLAIAAPVLGVLFHFITHTLSPDVVQITPYHSKASSYLQSGRSGQMSFRSRLAPTILKSSLAGLAVCKHWFTMIIILSKNI